MSVPLPQHQGLFSQLILLQISFDFILFHCVFHSISHFISLCVPFSLTFMKIHSVKAMKRTCSVYVRVRHHILWCAVPLRTLSDVYFKCAPSVQHAADFHYWPPRQYVLTSTKLKYYPHLIQLLKKKKSQSFVIQHLGDQTSIKMKYDMSYLCFMLTGLAIYMIYCLFLLPHSINLHTFHLRFGFHISG